MTEVSVPEKSQYGGYKSEVDALTAAKEEMLKNGYTFLEEFSASNRRIRGSETVRFEIYFKVEAASIEVQAVRANMHVFSKTSVGNIPISWLWAKVGHYKASEVDKSHDPRQFLHLPEVVDDLPTMMSDAYVEDFSRGYGLGTQMLAVLCSKLSERSCVHIVAFSELGMARLWPSYQRLGYTETTVSNLELESSFYTPDELDLSSPAPYCTWAYKVYDAHERQVVKAS